MDIDLNFDILLNKKVNIIAIILSQVFQIYYIIKK